MATITIKAVKARLGVIDQIFKDLEQERQDLLATLRTANRLNGVGTATGGSDESNISPLSDQIIRKHIEHKVTVPGIVREILGDGPMPRVELIEKIKLKKPGITPTVLASSLARMTHKGQVIKGDDDIYSLPASAKSMSNTERPEAEAKEPTWI